MKKVNLMLDLHKSSSHPLPSVKNRSGEIAVTDEKIDEIVYGLYGVTGRRGR